jgi:hypothetical protein
MPLPVCSGASNKSTERFLGSWKRHTIQRGVIGRPPIFSRNSRSGFVNIRLTRFNKIGRLYRTIIAAQVLRSCDLARRAVDSTPSSKRSSPHSCRWTGAKSHSLLSEMRSRNQSSERLGGIRGGRVPSGCQCRWHRPRQLGSAVWRHLPGQKRTEILWAFAAMVRTGLQKRM